MNKKLIGIFICLLFFGASVVSGINIQIKNTEMSSRGNTLYVGGSGGGNYTKIQDAIDNASNGDTVFVYEDSSPYYENIIIDKSIDFIGENRETTVIDGNHLGGVIYISADWVNIASFTIKNGDIGIYLPFSSNNTVTGNNISNNNYGIYLIYSSNNNKIYHNNLLNNVQNAYDECNNQWDNNYPSGGNYWDDYTGIDSDGDGIGDTPYPIPSGDNEDRYPLMEPWINVPPSTPTITAPTSGKPNIAYDFTFNSIDSDGDDVKFHIDWSDGDNETTSFVSSGNDVIVSHTWTNEGTYTITVFAEDEYGAVSGETTSQMIIEKSKTINNPFLNFMQSHPNMFPILQLLLQRLGLQ